jgi:hypothetical protein
MRRKWRMACAVMLVGISVWPGVGVTAMYRLGLAQLSQGAESIVLGTVTDQVSAWNDLHTAIYTDVRLAVEEAIKGNVGPEVTFRIKGGAVGDIGMRTSTEPTFHPGERVIVFLHTAASTTQLFGRQQGKFTVRDDTVTQAGQVMAISDFRAVIRAASR